MAKRITREFLEAQAKTINDLLEAPSTPYHTEGDKMVWHEGHHLIQGAYNGYTLERIEDERGSTVNALYCGFITAKNLSDKIDAYIRGIRATMYFKGK